MSASSIIRFDSNINNVYIAQSKIKGFTNIISGKGLFSKKHISKGSPVVVYYGNKITDQEIYDLYMNNPEKYYEINKYIRGTPNGYSIQGDKTQINTALIGVYVNDVACISCDKNEINQDILKEYAQTIKKCNLKTVNTEDYPIYYSSRRIKKNEELYAHYGIGYWLSAIGCSPLEISELNNRYDFNSFY